MKEKKSSQKKQIVKIYSVTQLDDDLADSMLQKGYNERDIVNLVRLFPPSSIRLQDTLTLQALKAIFSIMYDNHQFNYSNILFDKVVFLNVGIGYALRESIYRTNPKGYTGQLFKNSLYKFFDIFVTPVPQYKFSDEIKKLNQFLGTQRKYLMILTLLTITYYVICLFGPYGWQHFYKRDGDTKQVCFDQNTSTSNGVFMYLAFAYLRHSGALFFRKVSKFISNHIYNLMGNDVKEAQQVELNKQQSESPHKLDGEKSLLIKKNKSSTLDKFKSQASSGIRKFVQSKDGIIFGYIINLLFSQLAKLSLYTEVTFIMLTYYCEFSYIALFGLISTAFNAYFQLYNLVIITSKQCFPDKITTKLLSTIKINEFYEISTIGRNTALSTIFDEVSPFNVTVISNNFITRALVPQIAGKSMSNSVRAYVFKFVFGDFPHIILQLYFIIYIAYHPLKDPLSDKTLGELNPTLFITVINTGIQIIVSFYKLMSIRPSYLSQVDFDQLALEKTKKSLDLERKFFEKQSTIIHALTNQENLID